MRLNDTHKGREVFSEVRTLFRKARSFEALVETTGRALSAVNEEDACGFFAHSSYSLLAPLHVNC
jgi:hypothetical protein